MPLILDVASIENTLSAIIVFELFIRCNKNIFQIDDRYDIQKNDGPYDISDFVSMIYLEAVSFWFEHLKLLSLAIPFAVYFWGPCC